MKDYSNYLTDKPFYCNADGCSMRFANEDHLMVHKKRHDMILNLGLGQKGATFADQTPTPTQFIRNCEEVGLFQDLQNVNPFEETFKKAVEAVKAGQPQLSMEKSLDANPDDTLHTPNIFPHIIDGPNINQLNGCMKSENIQEDVLVKQELSESVDLNETDIAANDSLNESILSQTESGISLGNMVNLEKESTPDSKVILNVPQGHFVRFITSNNTHPPCNMVVIKNSDSLYSPLPLTAKEKLKKSLGDKKNGKPFQQKVPISKCPARKTANALGAKFSKFSKNALKLISKLENSECDSMAPVLTKAPKKKNEKFRSKESRSEFLARSRAASSRCREKKKMYVLYLEKVNGELSVANRNLQMINFSLRKQIGELRAELSKHKTCIAPDRNAEPNLTTVSATAILNEKTSGGNEQKSEASDATETSMDKNSQRKRVDSDSGTRIEQDASEFPGNSSDPICFTLDVAEVTLNEKMDENEIPLSIECNKPPDIIVRFNSVGNDFPVRISPDSYAATLQITREDVRRVYSEHSYFFRKAFPEVTNHKNYNGETVSTLRSSSTSNLIDSGLKKNGAIRELTSLNERGIPEQSSPRPLILLKPFKKRTLQKNRNAIEKT